ncbi:MAG: hypothetical protein Q7Q71_16190 [Verrucomicrobiota bacterium JB023]|nr:hypothetical protein [Verrucomicrobiota bacterium JB023]
MKTAPSAIFLSALILPAALADDDADDWSVLLKQRHLVAAGTYQDYVDHEGSRMSFAPIPEGGSEFELWAIRQIPGGLESRLLDTENVGAYLPTGTLEVITMDPYDEGTPRTRIDQGFQVIYSVDGLLPSDPDAPLAARQVLLDHNIATYTAGYEDDNLGPEASFHQTLIMKNGRDELVFIPSNIPGSDPYTDAGVEVFRLYALPDGEIAQLQLAEAKVNVWPLSEASFGGLDGKDTFRTVPEITVNLKNLYPNSTTWVQYYPGSEKLGTKGTTLSDSAIVVKDRVPRDSVLKFDRIGETITESGVYTLEVLTETPFGIERLEYTTITVQKDLVVRGSVNSLTEE